jgi:hypothetical protein
MKTEDTSTRQQSFHMRGDQLNLPAEWDTRGARAGSALLSSALGGSAGSRLAKQLGILASGSTLLRQLRRKLIKPSAQGPRVLGIDDWAWARGIDTARFSATWNVVRSSICCRTAVRKALRNGFVLTLERRLSAAIAPAYMPKRKPQVE